MQKLIIIRHGEKPAVGDNLSLQGLNRALRLPAVLFTKFGLPAFVYVPMLAMDTSTSHARMFQTATPFAVQYNLTINSKFDQKNVDGVTADVLTKNDTVLLVWEHHLINNIVAKLGIKNAPIWPDDDFDSIWIITGANTGKPILTIDHQNLTTILTDH